MIVFGAYLFNGHVRWELGLPNPNYAGALLATLLPWLFVGPELVLGEKRRATVKWGGALLIVGEALVWFLICKTYSRGSLVAAGLTLFYYGLKRSRVQNWKLIGFRVACVVVIAVLTGFGARLSPQFNMRDGAVTHRTSLWEGALEMVTAQPLHGWGGENSGYIYMNWFQEIGRSDQFNTMVNSYLTVAVEYGVPALMALLIVTWFLLASTSDDRNARHIWLNCTMASAQASILAWCIANLFTTLWIDYRLWFVPAGSSILVLCLVSLQMRRASLVRTLTHGVFFASLTCCAVLIAGYILQRKSSVNVHLQGRTIVVARRQAPEKREGDAGLSRNWHVWADKTVLGRVPGQEIRLWLNHLDDNATIYFHQQSERSFGGNLDHSTVVLFGRQVDRLREFSGITSGPEEIILFNPMRRPPPEIQDFAKDRGCCMRVYLPEYDTHGFHDEWLAKCKAIGADVIVVRGLGDDVRSAWPAIMLKDDEHLRELADDSVDRFAAFDLNDESDPNSHTVRLSKVFDYLRSVSMNGSLRQNFALPTTNIMRTLNIHFILRHSIDADAWGNIRSSWSIPALRTYLIPVGSHSFEWLRPNGTSIRLSILPPREGLSLAYSGRVKLTWIGDASYQIEDADRVKWTYRSGNLTAIKHPELADLAVKSRCGYMYQIDLKGESSSMPILSAQYDVNQNPVLVQMGRTSTKLEWSPAGILQGCFFPKERSVTISYRDDLVNELMVTQGQAVSVRRFTWARNPRYSNGDPRLALPMQVSSDGEYDYHYHRNGEGFTVDVISKSTRETASVTYDPHQRTISLKDGKGAVTSTDLLRDASENSPLL